MPDFLQFNASECEIISFRGLTDSWFIDEREFVTAL